MSFRLFEVVVFRLAWHECVRVVGVFLCVILLEMFQCVCCCADVFRFCVPFGNGIGAQGMSSYDRNSSTYTNIVQHSLSQLVLGEQIALPLNYILINFLLASVWWRR